MSNTATHTDRAGIVQPFAQPSHRVAQSSHAPAHEPELIEGELVNGAPYAGVQLAGELGISESTFRTRWFAWLQKVAPVELLKSEEGYTELARSLALEFKQVPSKKAQREQWVTAAKGRYSQEFMPSGVTPEGIADELGGALALLRNQGNAIDFIGNSARKSFLVWLCRVVCD